MYLIAAMAVGVVGGAAHGYKRSHGSVTCVCKDAVIGGIMYPFVIPLLPLTAFMPGLLAPTEMCKQGGNRGLV